MRQDVIQLEGRDVWGSTESLNIQQQIGNTLADGERVRSLLCCSGDTVESRS